MAIKLSDLAGKPWRCEKLEFGSPKRGTLDFTGHINTSTGAVTDAPYKDQSGGAPHKLNGEAKIVGTTVSFQLSDSLIVLLGVVFQTDLAEMKALVFKHVLQPLVLTDRDGIEHQLFDQVDEPWVITKP
jgi:hypothetical protein